jgi:hypothetical protein
MEFRAAAATGTQSHRGSMSCKLKGMQSVRQVSKTMIFHNFQAYLTVAILSRLKIVLNAARNAPKL